MHGVANSLVEAFYKAARNYLTAYACYDFFNDITQRSSGKYAPFLHPEVWRYKESNEARAQFVFKDTHFALAELYSYLLEPLELQWIESRYRMNSLPIHGLKTEVAFESKPAKS